MTIAEKISRMSSSAPAIKRLGIPAYNGWNEALYGVGRAGLATVFPQAIGLASTWNADHIQEMVRVYSIMDAYDRTNGEARCASPIICWVAISPSHKTSPKIPDFRGDDQVVQLRPYYYN